MQTLQLCLARHGETDWNAAGRIQGQLDIPLNARGRAQATALAAVLAGRPLDAIYSSDLARAEETARAVRAAQPNPVAFELRPEWRERHHGRMQGQTYAELALSWPHGHQRLRARDPGFDVDGGETLIMLAERCAHALHALRLRHRAGAVMVVTHGGVLDAVHRLVTGRALHLPRDIPIRNCAFHWLEHDGQRWTITSWGEEAHLVEARDELPD